MTGEQAARKSGGYGRRCRGSAQAWRPWETAQRQRKQGEYERGTTDLNPRKLCNANTNRREGWTLEESAIAGREKSTSVTRRLDAGEEREAERGKTRIRDERTQNKTEEGFVCIENVC